MYCLSYHALRQNLLRAVTLYNRYGSKMDYFTVRILLFTIGTAVKIGHNGPILCSFYHNGNCTFL